MVDEEMIREEFTPKVGAENIHGEDRIFVALEIRDTDTHDSHPSDCRAFKVKTIIVHNGLNEDVTIQVQGDRERGFSHPLDLGASFTVTAGTDDYQTLTDYWPYLRAQATCSTAPTSGSLDVWVEKVG